MEKAIAGIVLIFIACFLIAVLIIVSNFSYDDVEEIDYRSEEAVNMRKIKRQLLSALNFWISENQLTNLQVSEQLKIREITTDNIISQEVDKFTIDKLVSLLHRAGKTVTVSISN